MKKMLSTLVCGALLATTTLSADFLRVELGAGMWGQTPSGKMSYTTSGVTATDTSDETQDAQPYVWILIKHPVPIIPNLRLEYSNVYNTGKATGTFKDFSIPTGETSKTTLEMTQYDITPYYNILDNTFWITLDLGLNLKAMNTDYTAKPTVGFAGYTDSASVVVPMLYARTRVQIPTTELGLEADVKYISYDGSTLYDARAKIDYTLDFIPLIQPALEVGYRVQKVYIDNDDDVKVDFDFAGVYAGLMLRF